MAEEERLFHDGLTLARKATPRVLRPGRGEGLGDEWMQKLCLFAKKIVPEALRQGDLGNCWLVSAMSAAAEQPRIVTNLFKQTELSRNGKYKIRLFHPIEETWNSYELDDRLPVTAGGKLRNVQLSAAGELWPALLEKGMVCAPAPCAHATQCMCENPGTYRRLTCMRTTLCVDWTWTQAAMFGGYGNLEGSLPYVALKALTGATDERILLINREKDGRWKCYMPKLAGLDAARRFMHRFEPTTWPDTGMPGETSRDSDSLLDALMWSRKGSSLICVGTEGACSGSTGLEASHAYTLLRVATNLGPSREFDLLQLRNPHGEGSAEWTGAWSDGHPIWDQYPEIKAKLQPYTADDGIFWIERDDFEKMFKGISVCLSEGCAKARAKPKPAAFIATGRNFWGK